MGACGGCAARHLLSGRRELCRTALLRRRLSKRLLLSEPFWISSVLAPSSTNLGTAEMELKKQLFQKMKMRSTLLPCCLPKPALGWFFDLDSGFEIVALALLLLYDFQLSNK